MDPAQQRRPGGEFTPIMALVTFTVVFFSFFFRNFFEDNSYANMLIHDLIVVAIVALILRSYGISFLQLKFYSLAPTEYLFGIGAGLLVIGLDFGLTELSTAVLGNIPEDLAEIMDSMKPASIAQTIVLGTEILIISTFLEEIIFRGLIFGGFRSLGFWKAALLTSVMYALFFFSPWMMLPAFAMSLVMCWLFEKTGNLAVPMVAHLVGNILFFLEITEVITLP
jgi:membrane protease YdiL (CAAX protease family)